MEETFYVFSMLADTTVFTGTKADCENYKKEHETIDDSMYIIREKL